jgi:hypothetical protein
MKTNAEIDSFVDYVEDCLLRDLDASGFQSMASDWREAIEIIKQLENEVAGL